MLQSADAIEKELEFIKLLSIRKRKINQGR
jgi:hypothetical protein